jgi:hypothetical protein
MGNVARKGQKSYYLPGFDSLIAVNCAKHVTCIQRGQWCSGQLETQRVTNGAYQHPGVSWRFLTC